MACEYFVGDRYISENEFKALLNEGLLDTLLSNKKIDIKGFKIDSSKVLSQDTKIIKRLTVPANKLAKILAKEVSEREGYPANMLSALELNNTKTDFKIPLWASPYADKFESLLTSLVTNKIIKQKFPGGSYVLGSEEGFKIKEGDETAGDLKNSNIVFTSKFDATQGLQPMRYDKESGKILPAQIMIPFKFRNEQGEILNINDFIIKDETGRQMLDTSKIPEKLLQLFGFRIPTQERNSMAAVEIVGFLPEASGDLILAPRDFTKQMGSDFDVDKLYTYMYNHYYLNGKIYTNFKNSAKDIEKLIKIVKDQISELRDNMKISKEDKKLIDTYINEVIDSNEKGVTINSDISIRANQLISKAIAVKSFSEEAKTALNNAITQLSILNRSYKAARQNKILDLHLEMMTSTNPEIIASIVALDSYGEFEQLAKDLAEIRKNKGLIQSPITILSDIYQRTKYLNAAAGKNCLGAFSLDSTFNAIAQGKDLVYNNLDNDNQNLLFGSVLNPKIPSAQQILDANEPIAIFGNSIAKGDLSNKYTLKSQSIIAKAKAEKRELTETEKESLKYKSNIIRALQSTAADNEKAQILDKLNINDNSLQVIKAMTLLGFEENDIVGLITQDIIWEYFEALNKIQSSLTKYEKDAKEKIREELINKYDPQKKLEGLSPDEYNLMALTANKSGTELLDMVANSKFNPTISTSYNLNQIFLLDKFLKLEEVGATIQQIQSTINSESNGIPKSLLETANKVTQIKNLNSSSIFNASALLGEYNPKLNSYEPNTISGFAAIYGTEFANTIYRPFFPYQKTGFETLFQEVLTHIPGSNKTQNMSKLTEAQKTVFKGVKSFLYSNSNTNLFTANPDQERNRLFIDVVDGNMSLASILKNLSNQVWFQKNAFLNKLDFNININGTPSRIEFEAATAENFDERNIYEGFLSLLNKNFPIGTFNNIEYTSRTLAQELVAAAFLEGGMQGSKQYMKYVPIAYLKTLGFGEYLNDVSFNFVDTFKGTLTESGVVYSQPSEFTRQYFQNNPELVKNITLESLKNKSLQAPKISFTLNKQALENNFVESIDPTTGEPTKVQTQFLSIREPKGKFALYEFDSINKIYRRIPVLKDKFGFVQYNSENSNIIPIERENQVVSNNKAEIPAPGYNIQNIPAEVHKEFNVDNVNNTQLPAPIATLPISKTLSGTSEALDDLINALVDSGELSIPNVFLLNTLQNLTRPANFKLIYSKDSNVKAKYDYDNNILTINLNHNNFIELNDIANTLAHELIHSATGHTIKQYESGLIKDLTSAQITAIENLKSLQNKYIKYLTSQGKDAQLAAFTEDYKAWKKGNKSINFNKEQIADFYGAMKLSEFVTMALTDKAFQERLKNVKDSENKSLWNQIIDAITELINTLGITIPKGSILAGAIKSSMDLINANQEALMQQEEVFYSDEESAKMNNLENTKDLPIKRILIELKNNITDFAPDAQVLLNNPNPTLTEYQNVINGYEFDLSAELPSEELRQELESQLEDIKNSFNVVGIQPSTQTKESNFEYKNKKIDTDFVLTNGQVNALEKLVDFVNSNEKFITLQGAAGTGKTAVIGYLQKYFENSGKAFVYMAPTHAASAELAFATVKSGNKELPMTVASAFTKSRDQQTGKEIASITKKLDNKLSYGSNIIVIDEVSMLPAKDYQLIKEAIKNKGIQVIFMGDIKQIPEVDASNPQYKQVSKAFTDNEQINLTEVKRTESEGILSVLNALRTRNLTTIPQIENTEEIKYLNGEAYNKELVSTVKEDPENTVIISYTNKGVVDTNSKIRKLLGRSGDPQPGDIVVGYLGYSSKQIEKGDIANSVRYTIDTVEKQGSTYLLRTSSEKLKKLAEQKVKGVTGEGTGVYLQLSGTDSLSFEDLNAEDFATNNATISKQMAKLYKAKQEALKNPRLWPQYYGIQGEVAKFFAKNLIGDNYIYNPSTNQMELYNELTHRNIRRSNPELFVEKAIDYGHAVTIHKSQGSTIKNVFFDATTLPKGTSSTLMLGNTVVGSELQSLIYVGMSRASEKLVINTNDASKFSPLNPKKLNLNNLQNPEQFTEYPNMPNSDDSLADSPINKELYEKYLLLCGK